MEESLLALLLEQFVKFPDAKLSLLRDTEYATTGRYFQKYKSIPTAEGKDVLYGYLCRRGHFCKKETIAEMAHGIYEDLEERRKKSFKFNSNTDNL